MERAVAVSLSLEGFGAEFKSIEQVTNKNFSYLFNQGVMISPTLLLALTSAPVPQAESGASSEQMVAIFLMEIVLMLFFGRLLGELMQRIGQIGRASCRE